jgi:hypothetical protein
VSVIHSVEACASAEELDALGGKARKEDPRASCRVNASEEPQKRAASPSGPRSRWPSRSHDGERPDRRPHDDGSAGRRDEKRSAQTFARTRELLSRKCVVTQDRRAAHAAPEHGHEQRFSSRRSRRGHLVRIGTLLFGGKVADEESWRRTDVGRADARVKLTVFTRACICAHVDLLQLLALAAVHRRDGLRLAVLTAQSPVGLVLLADRGDKYISLVRQYIIVQGLRLRFKTFWATWGFASCCASRSFTSDTRTSRHQDLLENSPMSTDRTIPLT